MRTRHANIIRIVFFGLLCLGMLPCVAGSGQAASVKGQSSANVTVTLNPWVCATSMRICPNPIILLICGKDSGGCGGSGGGGSCSSGSDRQTDCCGDRPLEYITVQIPKTIQTCYLHLNTITIDNQPIALVGLPSPLSTYTHGYTDYLMNHDQVTFTVDQGQLLQIIGSAPGTKTVTFAAQFAGGDLLTATSTVQVCCSASVTMCINPSVIYLSSSSGKCGNCQNNSVVSVTLTIPSCLQQYSLQLNSIAINGCPLALDGSPTPKPKGSGTDYLMNHASITLPFDQTQFLQAVGGNTAGTHPVILTAQFGSGYLLTANSVITTVKQSGCCR